MLFHKRQDLANPARKLQDLANCRIWQIAGFGKSRAQTKQQTFFVGTLGCPLTKPSSTRIKLFNYGFWGHFSRFACPSVASLVLQSLRSCFYEKARISKCSFGGHGGTGMPLRQNPLAHV